MKTLLASQKERLARLVKFGLVGLSGVVVNTIFFSLFVYVFGIHYLISSAIATEISIVTNFAGNHLFTFKKRSNRLSVGAKFASFQLISLSTLIITLSVLWIFTTLFGESYILVWNLVAIAIASSSNYVLNSKITWKVSA